jgi:ATP-binding cassette subfamily B protein
LRAPFHGRASCFPSEIGDISEMLPDQVYRPHPPPPKQFPIIKSTLVSLIPRFYDLTAGTITFDGRDLREYQLDSLRQQISIVLQDVFLFYGTVRENILFGRPNATEAEMIAAAQTANAHEFITQLPEGYDTLIGERGVKLSGGQKQRLSIARAVLKDAPILILDEATSAVATETELLIQQALERLMKGRTTIIIAHRLSTIRNADKIVVLEDKSIREMGTHKELMRRPDGLYRKLNTIQRTLEPVMLTEVNLTLVPGEQNFPKRKDQALLRGLVFFIHFSGYSLLLIFL